MDYLKIHEICSEKDGCLVAVGAGMVAFISKTIDKLADKLKKEKLSSMREVAEEAENVMTELERRYSIEKSEKLGIAKGKAKTGRVSEDRVPHFSVMIAGKFSRDQQPEAYVVGMDGVAERAEKFDSLGSGSAYAEYLLGKLYKEDMTVREAATLATYVVEEVKKIDPGCGGTTQLVTMQGGTLKRWSTEEVAALVADITAREKGFIDGWWQAVKQGISDTTTR
jgi:hypothetical protein